MVAAPKFLVYLVAECGDGDEHGEGLDQGITEDHKERRVQSENKLLCVGAHTSEECDKENEGPERLVVEVLPILHVSELAIIDGHLRRDCPKQAS